MPFGDEPDFGIVSGNDLVVASVGVASRLRLSLIIGAQEATGLQPATWQAAGNEQTTGTRLARLRFPVRLVTTNGTTFGADTR
jgi:hypothetical protein